MKYMSAIYGFHFTREFEVFDLSFYPVFSDINRCKSSSRSLEDYQLTGYVFADRLTSERLFNLQAILSFIEHLDVRLSKPTPDFIHQAVKDQPVGTLSFPGPRYSGGGAVIGTDDFYRSSRKKFIELALIKLEDDQYSEISKFKLLFFKKVETFRRQPFIEITYFLLFSGLEAFARATSGKVGEKSAIEPIYRLLKSYGLDVFQDNPKDLRRSISTYSHIRNALFHQGESSRSVNVNGEHIQIHSSDFLFSFSMLVTLVIFKALNFDDGHTNWNCWIDRMLHR